MRIVPRQLQRTGMTGHVPYYGGRLTPGHAYAASHPPPKQMSPQQAEAVGLLRRLVELGVLSEKEERDLQKRVLR